MDRGAQDYWHNIGNNLEISSLRGVKSPDETLRLQCGVENIKITNKEISISEFSVFIINQNIFQQASVTRFISHHYVRFPIYFRWCFVPGHWTSPLHWSSIVSGRCSLPCLNATNCRLSLFPDILQFQINFTVRVLPAPPPQPGRTASF